MASHIVVCSNCNQWIDILAVPEVKMGYVECTNCDCIVDQDGNAYPNEERI
jgi:hypothetical protein